jgi:hypothetical protein
VETRAIDDLRYPIGRWVWPETVDAGERADWMAAVAAAPAALRDAVAGLDDAQLDTPYRPAGWTVRQVVHHVPDSHAQALIRFKLALTEDEPTIKAYHEDRWAELPDYHGGIEPSLRLLEGIHVRWMNLMRGMSEEGWARTFFHPEHGHALRLDAVLGMYAWHGRHHAAHIVRLRERERWG